MTITLPVAVAAYFDADRRGDANALSACFTDEAVVTDENVTHVGREAICRWKEQSSRRFHYTCNPVSVVVDDGLTVVTAHLVGTFPGSPIDLRYGFRLEKDRIASLEIRS